MLSCIISRHKLLWEQATSHDPHLVDRGISRHTVALGAVGDHGTAVALWSRIDLDAAAGQASATIAGRLGVRHATVSKWRTHFAALGLDRLQDAPRPGPPRRYDEETEQHLIDLVSQPLGHATWTAALLAETLGEVSVHYVGRVLRQHGIYLQRRRSHEESTDPEFSAKAADIVGLYL